MAMKSHEVIVVGAGPGGAITAYHLARAGIEVVLLERKPLPRSKPCGGGVTPKTAGVLPFAWQDVVEDTARRATVTYHLSLNLEWDSPICYMVNRARFDCHLIEAARAAGAAVIEGEEVASVVDGPQDVVCRTAGNSYRGKFVVGADGAHSIVARLFGRPPVRGIAAVAEMAADEETLKRRCGSLEVDFAAVPGGYGWVFPKQDHLNVGVGCFTTPARPLQSFLNAYISRLGMGRLRTIRRQAFPMPFDALGERTVARGRVILVGDAAGLADPFTGEGIYNACLSGWLAAQALRDSGGKAERVIRHYQSAVEKEILGEMRLARRLANVFYGLNHWVLTYLMKRPELLKELWGQLYTGSHRQLWRVLKKTVWRGLRSRLF
jgi:geranylgeranyl reductase family protein